MFVRARGFRIARFSGLCSQVSEWGLWSVQGCPEGPEGVQKMSRRCPEDVQKVSRRLEKNVGTSRESSAGVQKASGVVERLTQSGKESRLHRVSNPVSQSWLMGNEKETLWFADEGLRAFWTFWTFAKAC